MTKNKKAPEKGSSANSVKATQVAVKFGSMRYKKAVILLTCGFFAGTGHATLTDNLTIGNPKALSLGNAVTADPPGIDSVHYNPAGLSRLPGRQREIKLIGGYMSVNLEFGDYVQERQDFIQHYLGKPTFSPDFFADDAHNTSSEIEGFSLMLPFVGRVDAPALVAPLAGVSYTPPGSKLTFATDVYSPLMIGFSRADNDPGRWIGQRLSFTMLTYFSPSVAYKINDDWSIGGTITANYAAMGLDLPFREPHELLPFLYEVQEQACDPHAGQPEQPSSDFDYGWAEFIGCTPRDQRVQFNDKLGELSVQMEQALTFGVNVGTLWNATPWLTFGMVYQSAIPMNMEGEFKWSNTDNFENLLHGLLTTITGKPELANGFGRQHVKGTAKIDLKLPAHFAVGTSVKLTPNLKFNVDLKYTEWSEWDTLSVKFSEDIDLLLIAGLAQRDKTTYKDTLGFNFNLEDTWNWATGLEYQYNDQLALRFGVEDRPTSIPDKNKTPLLPLGSGKLFGLGCEYKLEEQSVMNLAFGYFMSKLDMPGGSSPLGNSLDQRILIYNPYQGTNIKTDLSAYLVEFSYRQRF